MAINAEIRKVLDNARGFANREQVANRNPELSLEGKQAAIRKIRTESYAYRPQAVASAVAAFDNLLARFNANAAARQAAQEAEARRWDYQRLNYLAASMTAKVKAAQGLQALTVFYQDALNSGDKHALRAFCEIAGAEIRTHGGTFDNVDAGVLAASMDRALAGLLTTPELEAINKRGADLADEAIDFRQICMELARFYGGEVSGPLGLSVNDEFSWLAASIHITTDTEGPKIRQDVTINPWQEERDRFRPNLSLGMVQ